MIKERYIWAIFLVIIILVAVYFRFYYQPALALNVSMPNLASRTIYPYQPVGIPISVSNTGSSPISNLSFGLYINGNISRVYKISIPQGKTANLQYNYTPVSGGTFSVSFVADPNKLYNIVNRQNAQASTTFTVSNAEKPEPYVNFVKGYSGEDMFLFSVLGYESSILYDNFTRYLYLSQSSQINDLLYPAIDVYSQYISQIAVAHAYYQNYTLVSVWMNGYLSPNSLYEVALGKDLNVTYNNNVSFVDFGNGTTLCSWYSDGWVKTISVIDGMSCTAFLNDTHNTFNYSNLYFSLKNRNASVLNYSGYNSNLTYAGDLAIKNDSVIYESLFNENNISNICYDNVLNISNVSYCSSTMLQGNVLVNQVTRIIGDNQINILSLSGSSEWSPGYNYSLKLAGEYKLGGENLTFVSAYANTCNFSENVTCSNPTLITTPSNTIDIGATITNKYSGALVLNGFSCSAGGNTIATHLSNTILPGRNLSIETPCYYNGTKIEGSLYGVLLSLELNYTYGKTTNVSSGLAEVLK